MAGLAPGRTTLGQPAPVTPECPFSKPPKGG
jgi:hypothetical protein